MHFKPSTGSSHGTKGSQFPFLTFPRQKKSCKLTSQPTVQPPPPSGGGNRPPARRRNGRPEAQRKQCWRCQGTGKTLRRCQTCDGKKKVEIVPECPHGNGPTCMTCNNAGQTRKKKDCDKCLGADGKPKGGHEEDCASCEGLGKS